MAYRVKIGARLDKDIRRLLSAQIGRAIGYLSGAIENDGSAIHATRKSLKRSRSILRLARPGLAAKSFAQNDRAFRDIARLLSHDRDREVMVETLTGLAAKSTGDDKSALLAALHEVETANGTSAEDPGRQDNVALAIAMLQERDRSVHALKLGKIHIEALAAGYARTYGEGRKALKTAYRIADDEAFHNFRKALQHHWRHCQLLAPAWPELMHVRIEAARDLSQSIGNDHDLSLVALHFADPSRSRLETPVRDRVARLARAEQSELRAFVKPLAARLYASEPQHMERAILDLWPAAIRIAKHARKPAIAADYCVDEVVPLKAAANG